MMLLPLVVAIVVTALTVDLPMADGEMSTIRGKLGLMVTMLPGAVFAALAIHQASKRRWSQEVGLLGAAVLMSVLLAGIMLFGDSVNRPPSFGEQYAPDGWYAILLWGTYFTGIVIVFLLMGRAVAGLIRRQIRPLSAEPKPT